MLAQQQTVSGLQYRFEGTVAGGTQVRFGTGARIHSDGDEIDTQTPALFFAPSGPSISLGLKLMIDMQCQQLFTRKGPGAEFKQYSGIKTAAECDHPAAAVGQVLEAP